MKDEGGEPCWFMNLPVFPSALEDYGTVTVCSGLSSYNSSHLLHRIQAENAGEKLIEAIKTIRVTPI